MMKQFLEPHVRRLVENGYDVEIACSEVLNRFKELQEDLGALVKIHRLTLRRSPLALSNFKGYFELRKLVAHGNYDLIWTNEPVMGVLTRFAARNVRKKGTKVLYMVHGFHFYDGAPLFNWAAYYPIERLMARFTDVICTINQEDCRRAKRMGFPKVEYIHGVGVDTTRMQSSGKSFDLRREFKLPPDAFVLLSVGELNKNKNQQVVLRALAKLRDVGVYYLLCGKGSWRGRLERLAARLGIAENVRFLGYRRDIFEIYRQADVFLQSSWREGMPLAPLEAAWWGVPMVVSTARGATDFVENNRSGFVNRPDDPDGVAESIKKLRQDPTLRREMASRAREAAEPFDVEHTKIEIESIVSETISAL